MNAVAVASPRSLLCELTYRCKPAVPRTVTIRSISAARKKSSRATNGFRRSIRRRHSASCRSASPVANRRLRPKELVAMTRRATERGAYTNLITQGTFLDDALIDALLDAGLAHVQISIQAPERELAAEIAGTDVHERKVETLRRVATRDVALTLNCVPAPPQSRFAARRACVCGARRHSPTRNSRTYNSTGGRIGIAARSCPRAIK